MPGQPRGFNWDYRAVMVVDVCLCQARFQTHSSLTFVQRLTNCSITSFRTGLLTLRIPPDFCANGFLHLRNQLAFGKRLCHSKGLTCFESPLATIQNTHRHTQSCSLVHLLPIVAGLVRPRSLHATTPQERFAGFAVQLSSTHERNVSQRTC